MSVFRITTFFIFLPFFSQSESFSAECPTPPTAIEASVTVKIDFEKKNGLYTYRYSLSNGKGALLPINLFTLPMNHSPSNISSPANWDGDVSKEGDVIDHFSWYSSIPSALVGPGSTKSDFVITSGKAPGLIPFYTVGKTGSRETVTINNDEEAIPDCPGFYDQSPLLESMVTGVTQGPVGDERLSVDIELKNSNGEHEFGIVSPYEDKGLINVLLKGKKEINAKEIDLSSLRFGVGKAPLVSSKALGDSNNILLQFDIPKVGIECGRDRVLLLTGKVKDGKGFLGGAPVKTKNCDKRPKRKYPEPSKKKK